MRHIRTKLTLAAALAIAAVMVVHAVLRVQRESEAFLEDVGRDHQVLGHALAEATDAVLQRDGDEAAAAIIEEADRRRDHVRIRWLPGSRGAWAGERRHAGGRWFVTRVPLDPAQGGVIELRESLEPHDDYLHDTVFRVTATTAWTIGVCALLVHLAGWLVLDRRLRPLLDSIRRIGRGDLDRTVPRDGVDELGVLGRELEEMRTRLAELQETAAQESERRLAALEQLRHADRLSTVGKLAAGVAHELGTPLNVVAARAKMIQQGESEGDEIVDDARVIREQAERMTRIIRQLLDFARRRPPERERRDVRGLAQGVLAMLEHHAARARVTMRLVDGEPVEASVDAGQLQQVLTNLVMNAIQAQPEGGEVELIVAEREGEASIEVCDRGPGIDEATREQLFEPFFTTKDVGEGTGLGLSVVHGIVEEHGGTIDVEDRPGGGVCFRVRLPEETTA